MQIRKANTDMSYRQWNIRTEGGTDEVCVKVVLQNVSGEFEVLSSGHEACERDAMYGRSSPMFQRTLQDQRTGQAKAVFTHFWHGLPFVEMQPVHSSQKVFPN